MIATRAALIAGPVVVWAAALSVAGAALPAAVTQKTSNDGIYTKAQADAAKAQFDKVCANCHAFTVAAIKRPEDLSLGDEPFLRKWEGRALAELITVIVMTMPNDGSAVVSDDEAVNLLAYVLQQNGFPAGPAPLTKETASALLARPK